MPLRRRPQDPSPRLLALLADGEAARRAEGPAGPSGASGPSGPSVEQPWLPRREWLEVGERRAAAAISEAGRERRSGLTDPAVAPALVGRHRRPRPPGPALLTLPAALRGARVSGPRAAVVGMVVVVLVAAGVFGVRVAWARAASAPEAVRQSSYSSTQASGSSQRASAVASRGAGPEGFGEAVRAGPPTAPSASGKGPDVVVHVVGQVRRPGVVVLDAGARVRDAVAKAGGALKGADLAALNLARPLVDGEQVRVPKPGEAPPAGVAGTAGAGGGVGLGDGTGGTGSTGSGQGATGPVNLNTANQAVLEQLPGVGPVLAQRIIDWRTEHGRFASVDELAEVSGIGEKMFAQLQGKVTV